MVDREAVPRTLGRRVVVECVALVEQYGGLLVALRRRAAIENIKHFSVLATVERRAAATHRAFLTDLRHIGIKQ